MAAWLQETVELGIFSKNSGHGISSAGFQPRMRVKAHLACMPIAKAFSSRIDLYPIEAHVYADLSSNKRIRSLRSVFMAHYENFKSTNGKGRTF